MERNVINKRIWGLASELGIGSEELHMILARETGKDSMRAASVVELTRLLDALSLYKTANETQRNSLSDRQLRYIRDLERKLGWAGEPERLRGFLKKYAKTDDVKWLTRKKAGTVIEGLKGLLGRAVVEETEAAHG